MATGVAVVLGKTKETGTGGATESESEIENATEKILLVGKECLEDTDNVPAAGRETRNAPGNGKGTEITETDTANLTDGVFKCEAERRQDFFCFCTKLHKNLDESKVRLKMYLQKSKSEVYFFFMFTSRLYILGLLPVLGKNVVVDLLLGHQIPMLACAGTPLNNL